MPTFMPFRQLADYDYGVKGFEVRFQEMIESYLQDNEINAPWWKYYRGSIFRELLDIYEESRQCMLLINLHNYYRKVTNEVEMRVRENKPVSYATFKRGTNIQ